MKKTLYLITTIAIASSCNPYEKDGALGQEIFSFLKNETDLRFDFEYFNNSELIKYIKTFNNDGTQVISSYYFSAKDLNYFQYKFYPAQDFILTVNEDGKNSIEGVPFTATKLEDNPNNLYCSFANPYFIKTTVSLLNEKEQAPFFEKVIGLEDHAFMIDISDEADIFIVIEMEGKKHGLFFKKIYRVKDGKVLKEELDKKGK